MFGEIFSRRVFIGKKTFWQWMAVRLALTIAKHSAIQNPTFAPISSMLTITKNTLSLSFKTCLQELPRNSFKSQPCILCIAQVSFANLERVEVLGLPGSEGELRVRGDKTVPATSDANLFVARLGLSFIGFMQNC